MRSVVADSSLGSVRGIRHRSFHLDLRAVVLLWLCSISVGFASGCQAEEPTRPSGFASPEAHPVTVELITEYASIQPGGQTKIGVHFDLEEGWHIYAKDPGDAGLPTKVIWKGPASVKFGPSTGRPTSSSLILATSGRSVTPVFWC